MNQKSIKMKKGIVIVLFLTCTFGIKAQSIEKSGCMATVHKTLLPAVSKDSYSKQKAYYVKGKHDSEINLKFNVKKEDDFQVLVYDGRNNLVLSENLNKKGIYQLKFESFEGETYKVLTVKK
jgi:hypothetical protein